MNTPLSGEQHLCIDWLPALLRGGAWRQIRLGPIISAACRCPISDVSSPSPLGRWQAFVPPSSPVPDLGRRGTQRRPQSFPSSLPQGSPKPQDITTAGDNNTAQSGGGCKRIIKKPSFCPLLNSAQLCSQLSPLSLLLSLCVLLLFGREYFLQLCVFRRGYFFSLPPHSAKETISSMSAFSILSETFNIGVTLACLKVNILVTMILGLAGYVYVPSRPTFSLPHSLLNASHGPYDATGGGGGPDHRNGGVHRSGQRRVTCKCRHQRRTAPPSPHHPILSFLSLPASTWDGYPYPAAPKNSGSISISTLLPLFYLKEEWTASMDNGNVQFHSMQYTYCEYKCIVPLLQNIKLMLCAVLKSEQLRSFFFERRLLGSHQVRSELAWRGRAEDSKMRGIGLFRRLSWIHFLVPSMQILLSTNIDTIASLASYHSFYWGWDREIGFTLRYSLILWMDLDTRVRGYESIWSYNLYLQFVLRMWYMNLHGALSRIQDVYWLSCTYIQAVRGTLWISMPISHMSSDFPAFAQA